MRRVFALLLLFGLATAARPVAVATLPPYAWLAEQVLGPGWEVRALVPPGANPHVYAPRASDLKAVIHARLVVMNGLGLDDWMVQKIVRPNALEATLVRAEESAGGWIQKLPNGEPDPHLWTDPWILARFAERLAGAAGELDPGGEAGYQNRARRVANRLTAFGEDERRAFAALPGRRFVAYKNPFSYLVVRYRLERVFLIGKAVNAEPSPRELAEAARVVRTYRIPALVTPGILDREARRIAANLGVGVVTIDLLDRTNPDYLVTWKKNLAALRSVLR